MNIFGSIGSVALLIFATASAVQAQPGAPTGARLPEVHAQTPATPVAAPPTTTTPAKVAADQSYVLGPADVIEVSILGRTDYGFRNRIAEDGTIQLQYLGVVQAANKTTQQLGDEVALALDKAGFFTHPVVKVEIASYASRYVVVLGNVATPGLVPVDRPYHLSEIVARVGGIRESGADYVVLRPQHGPERHVAIATLATGDASEDPLVAPGDKIYSPAADIFYVSGQIKQPGAFGIVPNMTFRMAMARAGGVTDSGNEKGMSLTRGGKKVGHFDLDGKVQPGDILVVPERLF